jgi:hypothetical protein
LGLICDLIDLVIKFLLDEFRSVELEGRRYLLVTCLALDAIWGVESDLSATGVAWTVNLLGSFIAVMQLSCEPAGRLCEDVLAPVLNLALACQWVDKSLRITCSVQFR